MSAMIPPTAKTQDATAPIPVGSTVATLQGFGQGEVESHRPDTNTYVVKLRWTLAGDAEASVYLQADQVQWRKKLFEMTVEERVERAMEHKQKGAKHFESGANKNAAHEFQLALMMARQLGRAHTPEEITGLIVPLLNNLALAHTKDGMYGDACEMATKALELEPTNAKSLYLRAGALRQRGDFEAAFKDAVAAFKLTPSSKAIRKEVEAIRDALAIEKTKSKAMFNGIFKAKGQLEETKKDKDGTATDASDESTTKASTEGAEASGRPALDRQKSDHVGDKRCAKTEGERGDSEVKHHKPDAEESSTSTEASASASATRTSASTASVERGVAKPDREAWWAPLVTPSFGFTVVGVVVGIAAVVALINAVDGGGGGGDSKTLSASARVAQR